MPVSYFTVAGRSPYDYVIFHEPAHLDLVQPSLTAYYGTL